MEELSRSAAVLLSGGLDSATALAIARSEGYVCHALSFCYGQRHAVELVAAEQVAKSVGVLSHRVIDIDLRQFGGSALTSELTVPKKTSAEEIGNDIPITYV
ncbi:MAG TPA: 7-cyano-7-deazaguanine synthase, partial [Pirellulaceae bacterium]|nr:7-cyano-7-deazaguanine synthase [Pirellulaceae bacterium]